MKIDEITYIRSVDDFQISGFCNHIHIHQAIKNGELKKADREKIIQVMNILELVEEVEMNDELKIDWKRLIARSGLLTNYKGGSPILTPCSGFFEDITIDEVKTMMNEFLESLLFNILYSK